MYCRKEMVKILKCYLIPKKSYSTLSKGAIFLANPFCIYIYIYISLIKINGFRKCSIDQIQS